MANIDLDFAATASNRPRALIDAYRRALAEEQPAHRPPPPPAVPKFSRIDSGQLIRALFLVALCLVLAQFPRLNDRAQSDNPLAAAVAKPL